jgi:hypothetical protein
MKSTGRIIVARRPVPPKETATTPPIPRGESLAIRAGEIVSADAIIPNGQPNNRTERNPFG